MHRQPGTLLLILTSALLLTTACTISQEVYLEADSTGAVHFDIEVEEFFNQVVEDFTVFVPEEDSDVTRMNIEYLQDSLNRSTYTDYADIIEYETNRYIGTFQLVDGERFFNDEEDELKLESLFTYEKRDESTTLSVYLDLDTYRELKDLVPLLDDDSFAIFGPEENIGVSEEEYLDMVSYLIGEEGPGSIKRSYITLILNTDSPITSHEGGEILDDSQIQFTIPLLDFLLLAEPISYSVTW